MEKVFPYRVSGGVKRPVVPFKVIHNTKTLNLEGIVDSGADYCIFPEELSEALGLKLTGEIERVEGICGGDCMKGYRGVVTIDLVGKPVLCEAMFLRDFKASPVVLGRKGVFDWHEVCFREKDVLIKAIDTA